MQEHRYVGDSPGSQYGQIDLVTNPAIVEKLEAGKVSLEDSIAIYERGEKLKGHCDKLLKAAEARIEKITLKADGSAGGTEPLDVE